MQNKNKKKRKSILSGWKSNVVTFFLGLTLFLGITSVWAGWPDAPLGENIAGWLGEIFDLNQSGSGQLALNSKKVLLPSDASPISDNKQIPTKEYVDTRVSAAGGTAEGGGAFTLIGGASVPSCPGGYASAMDGYWNCGYVNTSSSAVPPTGCFCSQFANYPGAIWTWSAVSNGTRCAVCIPAQSGAGGASTDATVIWATKNNFNGNLGGRTGADAKCVADLPDYLNGKCGNVHAFLSVDNNDEIRDMPNCDIDMDGSVKSWYDCRSSVYWFARQYNKFTSMANGWDDLADGSIGVSAQSAGVYGSTNVYWTGSSSNLANNGSNCSGWTSNSTEGFYGAFSHMDSNWISLYSVPGNNLFPILCACRMN